MTETLTIEPDFTTVDFDPFAGTDWDAVLVDWVRGELHEPDKEN